MTSVNLLPKFKNENFHLFMEIKILMSSDERYYIGKDGYNSDSHPYGSHLTNHQRCESGCLGGDREWELSIYLLNNT